jgi:hypothetical protein
MEAYEAEYDKFFGPVIEVVSSFAVAHGMALEKYYHEAPVLTLGFGHPLGGQSKIDVEQVDDGHVQVEPVRWLDDYRTFTRSLKWGSKRTCNVSPTDLAPLIEAALKECLSWGAEEWSRIVGGYEKCGWASIPESEFDNFANRWPPLKLSSDM